MEIIETWHNPNGFSWITIEKEDNDYYIFVGNKNGVRRQRRKSRDLEYIQKSFDWQKDFAIRMNETMKGVIEKLKNDPEAMERLIKSKGE